MALMSIFHQLHYSVCGKDLVPIHFLRNNHLITADYNAAFFPLWQFMFLMEKTKNATADLPSWLISWFTTLLKPIILIFPMFFPDFLCWESTFPLKEKQLLILRFTQQRRNLDTILCFSWIMLWVWLFLELFCWYSWNCVFFKA